MGRWFESSTTHHFPPLYTLASSGNYEASSWVCAKITGQYLRGIPPMTANNLIAELASSSAAERVHEHLERRSEERRVGKECRSEGSGEGYEKKMSDDSA